MRALARHRVAVAAAGAVVLLTGVAATDDALAAKKKGGAKKKPAAAAAPVPDDPATLEARALFEEANVLFDSGQFEKALALYQRAYASKPLPAFLINIAQCHRNLGHFEDSLFFYKKYLSAVPGDPRRAAIESVVADMTARAAEAKRLEEEKLARERAAAEAKAESERRARLTAETAKAAEEARIAEAEAARAVALASRPLWKRPWFWLVVSGAVVVAAAGGATGYFVFLYRPLPDTTLDPIDCLGCFGN